MQQDEETKIIFKNTRESKDVVRFLDFLTQLQEYRSATTELNKSFYMRISKNEVAISPNIREKTKSQTTSAIYTLNQSMYKVTDVERQDGVIYSLDITAITLFVDTSIKSKITTLSITFRKGQAVVKYEMGSIIKAKMVQTSERQEGEWPAKEGKVVKVFEIGWETGRGLNKAKQLILECTEKGIMLKKIHGGQFTEELSIQKDLLAQYDYMSLMKELQGQNKIQISDKVFMEHILQCSKLKINCSVSLLIVYDLIERDKIDYCLMMLEANSNGIRKEKLFPVKAYHVINPFLLFQSKKQNNILDPILKNEENFELLRKNIINNCSIGLQNEINQLGDPSHYLNMEFGKIEEGEEIITRKRKFEI